MNIRNIRHRNMMELQSFNKDSSSIDSSSNEQYDNNTNNNTNNNNYNNNTNNKYKYKVINSCKTFTKFIKSKRGYTLTLLLFTT